MKKIVTLFLSVLIVLASFSTEVLALNGKIDVFVYGVPLQLSSPAIFKDGRTLVPFRDIFEALGMTVEWDEVTKTVTGKNETTNISFVLGQTTAIVNDKVKQLDVPAHTINGYTLVPVRFVGEASGYPVQWDNVNQRVIIGSTNIQGDIILSSSNQNANVFQMHTTSGTGKFTGYTRLLGYPGEKDFAVYYKCSVDDSIKSLQATCVDLRNLDPNKKISWSYKGVSYTSTRKDIYNFLSDSSSLASKLGEPDAGLFSSSWQEKTFGQTYWDWFNSMVYSQDASDMADVYTDYIYGFTQYSHQVEKPSNPNSLGDWVSSKELSASDIGVQYFTDESFAEIFFYNKTDGFMRSKYVTIDAQIPLSFVYAENKQGEFGGVHIKKENGVLYFKKSDIEALGVFKLSPPR